MTPHSPSVALQVPTAGFARLYFLEFKVIDLIDVLLVAVIIYQLIGFMQGTSVMRVFLVFAFIYVAYLLVVGLKMELLSSILGQFTGFGLIAVIVLFQQEIRRFLLRIGQRSSYDFLFSALRKDHAESFDIKGVMDAVEEMATTRTGALLLFSRKDDIEIFVRSGSKLNAEVSKRLLLTIFNKHSLLHDGAVVIHQGIVRAVACILPISEREDLPSQYGTRHRAAVSATEHADILSLVVSEETGKISLSFAGKMRLNVRRTVATEALKEYASGQSPGLFQQASSR